MENLSNLQFQIKYLVGVWIVYCGQPLITRRIQKSPLCCIFWSAFGCCPLQLQVKICFLFFFTRFWCKNDEILGDLWLRLKKLIFLSFLHPCKNVWKMLIFWHFLHPCKNFWKMQISTCIWSMQHPKAGQIIQHHLKNKLRVNYLLTVAYRGLP